MNTFSLDTTQNIAIEYPLAGVGDRILATLIDLLIVIAYYIILIFIASIYNINSSNSGEFIFVLFMIFSLPVMFYNLACEIWLNGQTLGKKAMHIRVMNMNGGNASLSQYFIRWLLRLVDFYIMGFGLVAFISVIASQKSQRVGDIAAGTIVIKTNIKTGIENSIEQLQNLTKEYIPQYPEVEQLDYNDIALVKDVINMVNKTNNTMIALELANKMEQKLHISRGNKDPMNFLYTILTDYQQTH